VNQNRESSGWRKVPVHASDGLPAKTCYSHAGVSVIKDDTSSPPTERTYFSPACPMPSLKAETEIPNRVVRRADAYLEEKF